MQLFFVEDKAQLSKRDHELRDAAVRSHAAKFSHRYSKRGRGAKSRLPPRTSNEVQHKRTQPTKAVGTRLVQRGLDDNEGAVKADPDVDAVWSASEGMPMLLPQSILIQGQSDPFESLPVRIDSKTHELILHWRDNYLFPRHHVNAKTWYQSASAISDWQDARLSLSDPGLGYGLLAQISAAIALTADSRPLLESTLTYSQRSTVALRKQLENKEVDLDSSRLFRHVALLQGVGIISRNQTAALTHGRMLRRLCDAWLLRGKKFDVKILMLTLHMDVHMAVTFLVRPHFKPSARLVTAFYEASDAVPEEEFNVPISLTQPLNRQIIDTKLEDVFLLWTRTLAMTSFYGRRLWTFMNQMDVVNRILNAEDKISQQHDPANATLYHIQAYISLAALFFIRLSTLPEHFVAKSLFIGHTTLLSRLRYHLEISDILEDGHIYSQARLWALFAGAQFEYQAALLNQQPRAVAFQGWFNVELAKHVRRCELLTWVSVKEILEGFMYFEMVPDPSEWYPELLMVSIDSGDGDAISISPSAWAFHDSMTQIGTPLLDHPRRATAASDTVSSVPEVVIGIPGEDRRAQNRMAQRAHRDRQKLYVARLEKQAVTLQAGYNQLDEKYNAMRWEYKSLLGLLQTRLIPSRTPTQQGVEPAVTFVTERSQSANDFPLYKQELDRHEDDPTT